MIKLMEDWKYICHNSKFSGKTVYSYYEHGLIILTLYWYLSSMKVLSLRESPKQFFCNIIFQHVAPKQNMSLV